MEIQTDQSRVRINLSLTAKGLVQWDITSEFPTVEETKENLSAALDAARAVMKEKDLKEAGN